MVSGRSPHPGGIHRVRTTLCTGWAAGVDISVIALWLGHESIESTQIYLHADLAVKEKALARTAPFGTTPGRYKPADTLLAFLDSL